MDIKDEEEQSGEKASAPEDKLLGEHDGLNIYLKKGPYGFYIQLGEDATATTEKPKRIALPRFLNPEEVTFEQAEKLASLPFDLGDDITVNIGKFGQYIKQGNKSCSLTGEDNIFNITKERAEELLKGAKPRAEAKVLGMHPRLKQEIQLAVGRYGQYIKCGKDNYRIPSGLRGGEITLDDAIKVIDNGK